MSLRKYPILFKIKGEWLTWERWGKDMYSTLALAKKAIAKEYGDDWKGGICICNPDHYYYA